MSSIDKAIGVFDSGLGGISVLKELRSLMPQEDYLYYGDSSFAPLFPLLFLHHREQSWK